MSEENKLAKRLQAWLDVCDYETVADKVREPNNSDLHPWGSKGDINRAGDAIREGELNAVGTTHVDAWRAAHRYILNTFQSILRNKARGKHIDIAQRLKRRITIIDKLLREPKMLLSRMDDVAGCRLIFSSLDELHSFRERFHKSRFNHRRRNELDKYDYIKKPKSLGYRGIHDIYEYDANSIKGRAYKGLLLELQYRTRCQHAWATTVEIITHLTGFEPKFNRGDIKYIEFFRLASEVIARTCEDTKSCCTDITNEQVADRLEEIDSEIHVMAMLRKMRPNEERAGDASALILQMTEVGELKIHEFPNRAAATSALFKLEKEHPKDDIVLVTADTFESIRTSYRNYFSDVKEFVRLVEDGCRILRKATALAPEIADEQNV